MKAKKTAPTAEKESPAGGRTAMFDKTNYLWMLGGAAIMIVGYLLMAGGRSDDPNVFRPEDVYSSVRITIAPILILAGLVIEVFALFRHPKG